MASFSMTAAQSAFLLKKQEKKAQRSVIARAPEVPDVSGFTPPTIEAGIPAPMYCGSDGGLLNKARVEEFYVMMWETNKEHIFEMPMGGTAKMRNGKNMVKLSRKEQCLALTTQLRTNFKINPCFWRVYPNGEVQYLHPKDGQYPEKTVKGRGGEGYKDRSIMDWGNYTVKELRFMGKTLLDM